jgi:hypothetical protein
MRSDGEYSRETIGSEESRKFPGKTKILTMQRVTREGKGEQKVHRERFEQKPKHNLGFGMRISLSKQ